MAQGLMNSFNTHDYAEHFITESVAAQHARTRGLEIGVSDVTPGVGAFLRHLAYQLSAQSVVEVGTSAGVGALWLLEGMIKSGTLTSIADEMEHTTIAKYALEDAGVAPNRYRLITSPVVDVMTKLADRAYDMVVLRHDPEDLSFTIDESHRILRSGGVMVIDNFFGGGKVPDPAQRDPKTIALREAGKLVKNEVDAWISSLLPLGDGVLLATKL